MSDDPRLMNAKLVAKLLAAGCARPACLPCPWACMHAWLHASLRHRKVQCLKCTFNCTSWKIILSKSMGSNHTFEKSDSTPNHTFQKYDFNHCTRYEYAVRGLGGRKGSTKDSAPVRRLGLAILCSRSPATGPMQFLAVLPTYARQNII